MPLLLLKVCILTLAIVAGALSLPAAESFRYQNPITAGLDPRGVRDCQVFRDGDRWYLTATSWPHWGRQEEFGHLNPGVPLYSSPDLLNWTFEKIIVHRGGPEKWYHRRFWAPEVHQIGGKYYALFNASNPELGFPGQHGGYAVAETVRGPYRIVTERAPLMTGNDLTLFEDDDGKVWAFWNQGREFGIGFAELDLAAGRFLTAPQTAIVPGRIDWELDQSGAHVMVPGYDGRPIRKVQRYYEWDSIGIEGAYVVKENQTYYLFYSSWTRGYEIGYATAPAITGPWRKALENPFYGAQSRAACEKNGVPYTQIEETPFNQVGHNEIFRGPDGRLWLSCHGILQSKPDQPMLVIDPIWFDEAGRVRSNGPTHRPQVIKLPRP
jgi:xylan 1,4-beta-xylosidase